MEHKLVALLMVSIVLTGGASASVLHAPGVQLQQLIPLEVSYPNAQSPVLLSQPLGLTVDALLAAAGYTQSPAPVSEVNAEDVIGNKAEAVSQSSAETANAIAAAQLSASGSPLLTSIAGATTHLSALGSPQLSQAEIADATAQLSAAANRNAAEEALKAQQLSQSSAEAANAIAAQLSALGSLEPSQAEIANAAAQLSATANQNAAEEALKAQQLSQSSAEAANAIAAQLSALRSLESSQAEIANAAAQLSATANQNAAEEALKAQQLSQSSAAAQLSALESAHPSQAEIAANQNAAAQLSAAANQNDAASGPLGHVVESLSVPNSPSLTVGPSLALPQAPLPSAVPAVEPAPPASALDSASLIQESALPVAPLPTLTAADAQAPDAKLLDSITRGSFYIDTDGKLQMQATISSAGGAEEVSVVATDLSPPGDGSVTVLSPQVPAVTISSPSKKPQGVSNVNVNVNVNVNGDGTGSSFNATSVSKINAPLEVNTKCH